MVNKVKMTRVHNLVFSNKAFLDILQHGHKFINWSNTSCIKTSNYIFTKTDQLNFSPVAIKTNQNPLNLSQELDTTMRSPSLIRWEEGDVTWLHKSHADGQSANEDEPR